MALSNELISKFVKTVKNAGSKVDTKKETTLYGTVHEQNGSTYVKLDGSNLLTPISTTVDTSDGERVTVMIKNHTAVITGNISSPAAKNATVSKVEKNLGNGMSSVNGGLMVGDLKDGNILYNILFTSSDARVRNGSDNLVIISNDHIDVGNGMQPVTIKGSSINHQVGNVAYKPYYESGDSVDIFWYGAGYVSSSSTSVFFSVPLSKPVLSGVTPTVTSNDGLRVMQDSAFTHGSGATTYGKPTSYTVRASEDGSMLAITAKFDSTTNAKNNTPCGINASIKITFS